MKSANFAKDCQEHDGFPISGVCMKNEESKNRRMKNDCNKYLQPVCLAGI